MAEEQPLIDPTIDIVYDPSTRDQQADFGKDSDARDRAGTVRKIALAVLTVAMVIALLVVFFICGFVAGMKHGHVSAALASINSGSPVLDWGASVKVDGEEKAVVDWLDENIEASNIRKNLLDLTKKPHIAGSDENQHISEAIYQQWKEYGFDKVELKNYSVLLSYPNESNHNVLQLQDETGQVLHSADTVQEPPLTPGENDSTVVSPFNAFSGVGNATGPLVYVNFGRIEDFFYLTKNLSLDLNGSICIIRYGNIFRGDKVKLAGKFGCAGVILYSDPQQYAPKGVPVYPDGPSLPEGGLQRGFVLKTEGDPLTPGIPAIDGVYRRPYKEAIDDGAAPAIPVQPISYGDAIHFMSQLTQHQVPPDWQGQLENLPTYFIAQEKSNSNSTYIEVNNFQEERTIYDVIATIYGTVEPDHTVILGNHEDAWVFGGVDPNSGTAALMEITRAFSELRKKDWRPGRTILLCTWDAEEPGIIGSTEWVEDKGKLLGASTAAYLNVDFAVSGSQLFAALASPLLYEVIFDAAKMVECPNPGFDTLYDQWLAVYNKTYNGTTKPNIGDVGSGTDYVTFLQRQGISCSSMSYVNSPDYPVYHSVHDNFYWMSHFTDPDFKYHVATALVWSKMAILIATTPVLPYDPRDYANALNRIFSTLEKTYGGVLQEQDISLSYLEGALDRFTDASVALWNEIQEATAANPPSSQNAVRIINDKLMRIERAFIHDKGLPGRPLYQHLVFAPSSVNSYGSVAFPGVSDSIFDAVYNGGDWNQVRKQIDILRVHVRYAVDIMDQPALEYVS